MLLWTFEIPGYGGDVAIGADGTVFTTTTSLQYWWNCSYQYTGMVIALNGTTGAFKWSYCHPPSWMADPGPRFMGSVSIGADGTLYTLFGARLASCSATDTPTITNFTLLALHPASGQATSAFPLGTWFSNRCDTGDDDDSRVTIGVDGTIYVPVGSYVNAINASTPWALIWNFSLPMGASFNDDSITERYTTQPTIGADGTVFFVTCALAYVAPSSGGTLFSFNSSVYALSDITSMPASGSFTGTASSTNSMTSTGTPARSYSPTGTLSATRTGSDTVSSSASDTNTAMCTGTRTAMGTRPPSATPTDSTTRSSTAMGTRSWLASGRSHTTSVSPLDSRTLTASRTSSHRTATRTQTRTSSRAHLTAPTVSSSHTRKAK